MIKNCVAQITLIDEESLIGDTLDTFNRNFNTLRDISCGAYGAAQQLKQTSSGAITRIKGVNGIVAEPETGVVTISQSYSPPWHVGETDKPLYKEDEDNRVSQQVAKSNLLLNYFNQLATLTPVITGVESYTQIFTNNPNPVVQYTGLVTLGDGRLFLFPGALGTASIYNPYTGKFTKPNTSIPVGFANGILLPDGRVCLIPGIPKNIHIWSPQTGELFVSKINLSIPGISTPYNGGTLLPDGKILLTPYERQDGTVIYNPNTDTIEEIKSTIFTTTGGKSFFSGTLSLDGKYVYLTPHDSSQMVRVATKKPYEVRFVGAGNLNSNQKGAYSSAVLLPNGKIFLTPYNSSTATIYDPNTDTFSPAGARVFVQDAKNYITSILLPDGRVCMVPYGAGKFAFFNYKDNSIIFSDPIGTSFQKYLGATVLEDGNIFVAPYVEDRAVVINTGNQQGFMRATVTGLFYKETL